MNSDYEELRSVLSGYGLIKDNAHMNAALIDRVAKIISKEYRLTKLLAEDEGPISLSAFMGPSASAPAPSEPSRDSPKEESKEPKADPVAAAKKAALAAFEAQNRLVDTEEGSEVEDEQGVAVAPVARARPTQDRSPQQAHFAGILNKTIPKNLPPTIGTASGGADGADSGEGDVDIVEGEGPDVPAGLRGLFTEGLPPRRTLDEIESRTAGKNRTISRRS